MERPTRRQFLVSSGVTGALALAGCTSSSGGSGDSGSNSGKNGQNAAAGTTKTAKSGSKSGTTEIKFWHAMSGDTAKLLTKMGKQFEQAHDGISVTVTPKGSYRDTMNATFSAIKAGSPPAVAQIFDIGTAKARTSGAFVPVQKIFDSGQVNFDNFLNPVLNYYRIGDTLNSMPFNSSNAILYYNKDAFKKAGLDPSSPPRTYSDFTDAATKLVNKAGMKKGASWANHGWFVEQWFAEQDQLLVNQKNGRKGSPTKAYLTSDAGKNVFEWWTDLYKKDGYLNPGIEAWSAAKQAFIAQKVGMLITSTAGVAGTTKGAKENGFDMGTGYLPTPNGDRKGVVIGGGSLWVPKSLSSEKQQAAATFLAWLTQPEQQVTWHKNTGYFPVRKEAVKKLKSDGWFSKHPNFKTAFDQLQATKDTTATRGAQIVPFPKVRTEVENGFVSMMQGTSVDKALKQTNDKVESTLKRSSR